MRTTTCPISPDRVDRVVVRLTGGTMAVLLVLHVATGWLLPLVLAWLDYGVRATGTRRPSPVATVASRVAAAVGSTPDPIDRAPKLFAARAGWTMATTALVMALAGVPWAPLVAGALAALAMLESVGNLCIGCVLHSHVVVPIASRLPSRT